jgi:hypothetical protein
LRLGELRLSPAGFAVVVRRRPRCPAGAAACVAVVSVLLARALARTMSARRLPGTSALAASKSATGSSTRHSRRGPSKDKRSESFPVTGSQAAARPVGECGERGLGSGEACRCSLFRGRPDEIYCSHQSATRWRRAARQVEGTTRGAGRPDHSPETGRLASECIRLGCLVRFSTECPRAIRSRG